MGLSKFKICIAGDSRLVGLQKSLDRIIAGRGLPDVLVNVQAYRGADIQMALDNSIKSLKGRNYDIIYFAAGVNELSIQTGHRRVLPAKILTQDYVDLVFPKLENAALKLQTICKKVVVCELIGMSFSLYNGTEYDYVLEQTALNDATLVINTKIAHLNGLNDVRSPLIQSYTHKIY